MAKGKKPAPAAVLKMVRENRGLDQGQAAEILGVAPGTLSDYERGDTVLNRREVEDLTAKLEAPRFAVDLGFDFVAALRGEGELGPPGSPELPIPISREVRASLVHASAEVGRASVRAMFEEAFVARARLDRQLARENWADLDSRSGDERKLAIESNPNLVTWAFAELLAILSREAAPERHELALQLGELALLAADGAPAAETLRDHLKALAWGSIGNARRVAGRLREGESAFLEARKLWPVGAPSPGDLLSEATLFSLEASLRRDLREFDTALELIDQALDLTRAGHECGLLFLKQSSVFEQQVDPEGSIGALRQAITHLGETCPAHQRMGAHLLLALNLDHLGRHAEALEVVPAARQLAIEVGSEPNLLRLLWLEARAWAALGRRKDALAPLDQVRRDFKARGNLHDAALAGLELATLLLEEGKTADTRELATELTRHFRTMGILREQLAAVWLFLESAEREAATAELARQAAAALRSFLQEREASGR